MHPILDFAPFGRFRYLGLHATTLLPLCQHGAGYAVRCLAGVPEGAELMAVKVDGAGGNIAYIYQHESFDLIAQDQQIPPLPLQMQLDSLPAPPVPQTSEAQSEMGRLADLVERRIAERAARCHRDRVAPN